MKWNEEENSKACQRISHSPHIHPPGWAAETTNDISQIKSLSQLPQRQPFQKFILRAFSPNTAHYEWTLLKLTWHFDLGIHEKRWKVQQFPSEGVVGK